MLHFFISLLNLLLSLLPVRLHFRLGHESIQGSMVEIGLIVDKVEFDISIGMFSSLQTSFSDKCSIHFSRKLLQLFLNLSFWRVSILVANRRHLFGSHLSMQFPEAVDATVEYIVVTGSIVSELVSAVLKLVEVEVASDVVGVVSELI